MNNQRDYALAFGVL